MFITYTEILSWNCGFTPNLPVLVNNDSVKWAQVHSVVFREKRDAVQSAVISSGPPVWAHQVCRGKPLIPTGFTWALKMWILRSGETHMSRIFRSHPGLYFQWTPQVVPRWFVGEAIPGQWLPNFSVLKSHRESIKMQTLKLHPQRFRFSRAGLGPRDLHF